MTVFDDAMQDIFKDRDFIVDATYDRRTISVIYDAQFVAVNGVATRSITAEALASDVEDVTQGKKIIISDTEYTVADIEPTGDGTTLLVLSRDP